MTLAAVDVGVLNITEMKNPKPFDWFFAQRRYDVLSYDIYSKIIEMLEGKQATIRYGGDADLRPGGKRPETKVKIVSLFKGPVRFDAHGEAEVDFKLPNFNGKLRLMAVAFSKDKFGSAEEEVQVAAPLVTQLSTPRFLAPGDEAEFTLDVHNLSGQERDIQLELEASEPLLLRNGTRQLSLDDQQKSVLSFPVKAQKEFGASKIKLQLRSGQFELTRNWQLGVRPGYPGIARKRLAVIGKGSSSPKVESLKIGDKLSDDLLPSTLEADLKISPVIALNLQQALQGLINYPYGCLEQVTSSIFPLIYARAALLKELGLPEISSQKRLEMLEEGIARISSMQKTSGGFGQWHQDSREAPWLTLYACDFLLYARQQGLEVPKEMLQKALKRVEQYFLRGAPVNYGWRDARHFDFAVRSYAAYVLSRLNRASLGTLRTLFDNRKQQALSRLPLMQTGIALYHMGDSQRGKQAVQMALDMKPEGDADWSVYGSAVRDTALSMALLLEHKIKSKNLFELMLELQDELRGREYLSTQEKFAVFKAGAMLSEQAEKEWKAKLQIGSETRTISHKGAYVFEPSLEEIQKGLEVSAVQEEQLFVSAVLTGYPKAAPKKVESGMSIKRRFYNLQGQRLEKRSFNIGEMILVRLDVSSEKRLPDALVVDLLPAGMEIENQNLEHSMQIGDIEIKGEPVWKKMQQVSIQHQEYRDDRYVCALVMHPKREYSLFYLLRAVAPGRFSVPPAMAESMYRPEIRAIGEADGKIRVLNSKKINQ